MEQLSEQAIIERIESGTVFDALIDTGAFSIRVGNYVPAVFTAIHDGHGVDPAIAPLLLVSPEERRFEEDPFTGDIVDDFSISLRVHHSRYFYDLNRCPDRCIYDEAWGKKIWQSPLSASQQEYIRSHHRSYYRVLDALLCRLEYQFDHCVLYDLHSYNYSRLNNNPPLFNIGSHYINRKRYNPVLQHLAEQLNLIWLRDHETRAVFDEVFTGIGYQAEFVHTEHSATLCVPLEIKKIFMGEQSLVLDSLVAQSLFADTKQVLASSAAYFSEVVTKEQFEPASFLPDNRN